MDLNVSLKPRIAWSLCWQCEQGARAAGQVPQLAGHPHPALPAVSPAAPPKDGTTEADAQEQALPRRGIRLPVLRQGSL